jgi:GPH family glycoside/pentoside/hexuronide:cation symporter
MVIERIKLREKISYGVSSLGGGVGLFLAFSYMTLFGTDVMGISAAVIGTVFLVCEISDAVTDLFIVHVLDRTQTRWGKYRPWLLFSGVPAAIILVLLFWSPSFLTSNGAKIAWLFGCYFLMTPILLTGYSCPQYIMLTVMTDHTTDRLDLASARSIGESLTGVLTGGIAMAVVLHFGTHRDVIGWRYMVVFFGIFAIISCIVGFAGTRERVHVTNQNLEGGQLTLKEKLSIIFRSRTYIKTLILNTGVMLTMGEAVLLTYYCIYVLGRSEWIPILGTASWVSSIAASCLLPVIGRKYTKRSIIAAGCVLITVAAVIIAFANALLPAILFSVCKGFGYGLVFSCCGILWADASDHIEMDSGIAVPGLVLATGSKVQKVVSGLTVFAGTMILTIGRYDAALEMQSSYTLGWIRYGITGALLIAALITLVADLQLTEFEKSRKQTDIES